jgi:hypothetical protein
MMDTLRIDHRESKEEKGKCCKINSNNGTIHNIIQNVGRFGVQEDKNNLALILGRVHQGECWARDSRLFRLKFGGRMVIE